MSVEKAKKLAPARKSPSCLRDRGENIEGVVSACWGCWGGVEGVVMFGGGLRWRNAIDYLCLGLVGTRFTVSRLSYTSRRGSLHFWKRRWE